MTWTISPSGSSLFLKLAKDCSNFCFYLLLGGVLAVEKSFLNETGTRLTDTISHGRCMLCLHLSGSFQLLVF